MATVNSFSDIPGGERDAGTCNGYAERCSNESWNYTQMFSDYSIIKAAIDDVIASLADAIETTDTIKGHFDNGAYNDGITDFSTDLSNSSTSLQNVKETLETMTDQLGSAISEIAQFISFCKDRGETWINAASFLAGYYAKNPNG